MKKLLSAVAGVMALVVAGCSSSSKPLNTLAAPSVTSATVGQNYSVTLSETGGKAPYTWAMASGSQLPAGLSLNAQTGVISGMPTAVGSFPETVEVTDASSPAKTQSVAFTLTIADAPMTIGTTTLPGATQGTAYSQTLSATGGYGSYTWSVEGAQGGGGLPAGLTLSPAGVLSGTPTASGTSTFTVVVTDSAGGTQTQTLSLTIAPPPAPTLLGTYIFKADLFYDGTTLSPAQVTRQMYLGSLQLYSDGSVTGEADSATDTDLSSTTLVSGVWSIGPDGRGTLALSSSGQTKSSLNLSFALAGPPVKGAFQQAFLTLQSAPYYGSGYLVAQQPSTFTQANLQGTSVLGWSGDTNTIPGALVSSSQSQPAQIGGLSMAGLLVVGTNLTVGSGSTLDIATNQAFDSGIGVTGNIAADATPVGNSTAFATYGRAILVLSTGVSGNAYGPIPVDGYLPVHSVVYMVSANTAYVLSQPADQYDPLYAGKLIKQQNPGDYGANNLNGTAIFSGTSQGNMSLANMVANDQGLTLYGSSKAVLGNFTFNANGNFSAAGVQIDAGNGGSDSFNGTYTVSTQGRAMPSVRQAPILWLTGNNKGFGVSQPTASGPTPMLFSVEPQTPATEPTTNWVGVAQPQSYLSRFYSGYLTVGANANSGTLDLDVFTDMGSQLNSMLFSGMLDPGDGGYLDFSDGSNNTEEMQWNIISPTEMIGLEESNNNTSPSLVIFTSAAPN